MPKQNILIVEDDEQISKCAAIRLEAAGYRTDVRHDGISGLKAAQNGRPDAIVLDVRMPVQDGLTTLNDLKQDERTKDIPVVMLSASIVDEEAALDGGARYFIRKPFVGSSLIDAISSATGKTTD